MVNLSDHYNTSKWGKLADQKLDFWPITKSGIEVVFNEKWILPKKNKIIKVTNLTGNSILADYPPIRALFEQKQHEEKLYYDSNSIKFFSKSPNTHITITIYKDKNGNTIVIAKK
jgi:hypothetical protein